MESGEFKIRDDNFLRFGLNTAASLCIRTVSEINISMEL